MQSLRQLEPSKSSIWITAADQVKGCSLDSLERALLTGDGAGKEIKKMCLEELKKRITGSIAN